MALLSPGVDISVSEEGVYSSSATGTVPLIIIGTHEYKIHPNGSDIASGTLPENANKLYLISSQRELIQTFGNPVFYSKNGTSMHGFELNEYGLLAAYHYLGVANRAFVIRADVDYAGLFPQVSEPRGEALGGTYWLDTANTTFGIHSGVASTYPNSAWTARTPVTIVSNGNLEYRVIGSREYDASTDPATITAGNLVVNGTSIAIVTTDTLLDVVSKINAASITGVIAYAFRLAGKSRLAIFATTSGSTVEIGTNSTPAILTALGFNGAEVSGFVPKNTVGNAGDFAVSVASANDNTVFQKITPGGISATNDPLAFSAWFEVGSKEWILATPTRATGGNLGSTTLTTLNAKVLSINVSNASATKVDVTFAASETVASVVTKINDALAAAANATGEAIDAFAIGGAVVLVNKVGGDIVINSAGDAAKVLGLVSTLGKTLTFAPHYQVPRNVNDLGQQVVSAGSVWINTTEFNNGSKWAVKVYNGNTGVWTTIPAPVLASDVVADSVFGTSKSIGTLYVRYNITGQTPALGNHVIRRWNGSAWENLTYNYGDIEPTTSAPALTRWFNDNFRADIMIADGDQWVGYRNRPENFNTNPDGVMLAGSAPATQNDGSPLVQNDLWIDTSDTENYPRIYRYQSVNRSWVLVNNADNSSPFGIVFGDARATTETGSTKLEDLLVSDYLDPDAPDPRLYPDGTLLFNTRFSTNNVKEWHPNWFAGEYNDTNYLVEPYNVGYSTFEPLATAGRWVTISGNDVDGSPLMGRKAQRAVIVRALAATISGNEDIRAETIFYNLISAPGYVELIDEMVTLNTDKKETAFIVGDTPIRLKPNSTEIQKWANTELSGAASNSEKGITTFNPYVGVYYPWGYSTNVDGFEVMIPPSSIALRTIAYNDQVAYPWYAPAGFNRGMVTNATNVGYLNSEGEFVTTFLNEGQRDTLYTNNINPITYIANRGLCVMGNKTRHSTQTPMDRVNTARLVNYLRYQFDILAKPFLFEPNDFHTRESVKQTFDRFLSNLVTLRALDDFITVCDESNNTRSRVAASELWIDVAIQGTKAVEFIYIPLRVVDQTTDLTTLYSNSTQSNR